ncbi:hypothetical protein [Vallitalea guaymasensis]|uniref:hypothetical protein n=1 Tax=Vallitalea guaymasensis TaxID=1185412 RepID=UPI002352DDDF|nr:hypothetical protein [Vallitalea guaymasensis]
MKVVFIYNPYCSEEVNYLEKVREKTLEIGQSVTFVDFEKAKGVFDIRDTPAVVMIRDDLQGKEMLEKDESLFSKAAIVVAQNKQKENSDFYKNEIDSIRTLIENEKEEVQEQLLEDMMFRGVF